MLVRMELVVLTMCKAPFVSHYLRVSHYPRAVCVRPCRLLLRGAGSNIEFSVPLDHRAPHCDLRDDCNGYSVAH